jgi:hypothetical protein
MLVWLDGALLTYLGRSLVYVFFGGGTLVDIAGSSHSPHAGAFTRSLEFVRVVDFDLVPTLLVVTTDEACESTEPRLSASEELFRAGSAGGGRRTGSGGGAGLLPIQALTTTEPFPFSGGLLKDLGFRRSGRLVGICGAGRGGSPGILPI